MSTIVDARGYLCPQPLMMTVKKMKEINKGVIEIFVDDEAAKENISRTVQEKGWELKKIEEKNDYCKIVISK